MGARSLHDLRAVLAVAVKQGVALAAFGVTASCGGKSERADHGDGSGTSDNGSASGTSAFGGSTNTGGTIGVPAGSPATAGSDSMGGVTSVAGSSSTGGNGALGGSAGTDAGGTGAGGTDAGGTGSGGSPELSPYPLEEVGCFGPTFEGGYAGQCCVRASCYTPDAGACHLADQRPPIPLPAGSGTCGCSPTGSFAMPTLKGPYAPNPDGMTSPEGSCCYLVGWIGCEGRPLLVDGVAIVAPLARRGDWCARLA